MYTYYNMVVLENADKNIFSLFYSMNEIFSGIRNIFSFEYDKRVEHYLKDMDWKIGTLGIHICSSEEELKTLFIGCFQSLIMIFTL